MRRLGALFVLGLLACTETPTQVLVWIDIPDGSEMRMRAERIEIRVLDQDGNVSLEENGALSMLHPPVSVSLVPKDDDAARVFRLEASLFGANEVLLGRQSAEGSFTAHALAEIWLRFEDACLDVACGRGHTCIGGSCVRACFAPSAPSAPGTTQQSMPAACPCECTCDGDVCSEGYCTPAHPVSDVFAGFAHACALADGALYCWGDNGSGQLGLGDRARRDRPALVALDRPLRSLALGELHSCAVLDDGSLWCWGDDGLGQLGDGGAGGERDRPVRVDSEAWAVVGAGARHACATRMSAGSLYCWGDNSMGQIGTETPGAIFLPTLVQASDAALGGFTEVLPGVHHTCARQSSGSRLWCWGTNSNGVLGRNLEHDNAPHPIPEQVMFPDPSGVKQAAAGGWHMVAVSGAGEIYTWGDEANGRLGLPVPDGTGVIVPTHVMPGVYAEAGLRHTCVIQKDSSLWCFGTNERGELGVESDALLSDLPVQLAEEGWEKLALGSQLSCGVRKGGALYCWGSHENCRLGIGAPCEDGATPVMRRSPARVCF